MLNEQEEKIMIYGGVVSIKDEFNQVGPLRPPTEVPESAVSQQKAKSVHKAKNYDSSGRDNNAYRSTV